LLEKNEKIQTIGGEGILKPGYEDPWHFNCFNYNFALHNIKVRNIFERVYVFLTISSILIWDAWVTNF